MNSYIHILTQTRGAIAISVRGLVGTGAVIGVTTFGVTLLLTAISSMAGA